MKEINRRDFLNTLGKASLLCLFAPKTLTKVTYNNSLKEEPSSAILLPIANTLPSPIQQKNAPSIIIPKSKLTFYNIHTGEWLKKCDIPTSGKFSKDLEEKIKRIFMDHRSNKTLKIDPKLIQLLQRIMQKIDSSKPIHLVSGYRSEESNAKLRLISSGVAKKSYHTKGMAADIFLEGVSNQRIQKIALQEKRGGVGRYKQFVHVDTGKIRKWGLLFGC